VFPQFYTVVILLHSLFNIYAYVLFFIRIQGVAIGQALIEAGYLDSIAEQNFLDGCALYRPRQVLSPQQYSNPMSPNEDNLRISQEAQEPLWVKQIPQQDSTTTGKRHVHSCQCYRYTIPYLSEVLKHHVVEEMCGKINMLQD
jgi:hypothetical protein